MNDDLPPLPEYASEFRPRWPGDPGGFNEAQMRDVQREAYEAGKRAALAPKESSDD
jgi:hypothetical protein